MTELACVRTSEREKLIRALVEDGDKLWATNNGENMLNAILAWKFAEKYSPKDPGILERVQRGVSPEVAERDRPKEDGAKLTGETLDRIASAPISALKEFSPQTLQLDLVNLRMLLDRNLVGTRRVMSGSFTRDGAQVVLQFFVNKPSYSLKDLRSKFGPPVAENSSGGQMVLVYGRFAAFCGEAGDVVLVAFKPFE